jgi:hypothetical protein
VYERNVYALLDFLGDIGGLQSALLLVGVVLFQYITRKFLLSALFKELYQIKFDRGLKKSKEPPNRPKNRLKAVKIGCERSGSEGASFENSGMIKIQANKRIENG